MSVPNDEFEQNIIKSIDTLLEEDKTTQIVEHIGLEGSEPNSAIWPQALPHYMEGNSLLIGGENYVKWSTIDSEYQQPSLYPKPSRPTIGVPPPAMMPMPQPTAAAPIEQQSPQTIAATVAAMNITQPALAQYLSLLTQYNLICNGQTPTLADQLLYSINPNYARLGRLLNASEVINRNIATYNNYIQLAAQLNGMRLQSKPESPMAKRHFNGMQKPGLKKQPWNIHTTLNWFVQSTSVKVQIYSNAFCDFFSDWNEPTNGFPDDERPHRRFLIFSPPLR